LSLPPCAASPGQMRTISLATTRLRLRPTSRPNILASTSRATAGVTRTAITGSRVGSTMSSNVSGHRMGTAGGGVGSRRASEGSREAAVVGSLTRSKAKASRLRDALMSGEIPSEELHKQLVVWVRGNRLQLPRWISHPLAPGLLKHAPGKLICAAFLRR